VTVPRSVLATVAMKDSAVAGGIVPACCMGLAETVDPDGPVGV
jgi:hypothetical protein